ncbi:hypothetical protein BYT27DRAFT_7251735 [Phlegmacium glaucopus]|nr:hypothetical protein BYT27DRAFT_7251735 [Phlegmacium glaucopus]
MPPRTRCAAAVDVEIEDEERNDEEDDDEEAEIEVSGEDRKEDEDDPSTKPITQPTLKITLKITPRRKAKTKVIQDIDIESEDPTSPSVASDDAAQSAPESGSRSTAPSTSVKPMTTRQAVLASVVDSSHVSLNEGSRSKKQPLNETELALRREETARKRKNLSEKKLEDEKAETINRLLKKQISGSRTPKIKIKSNVQEEGEEADGDEEEDDVMDIVEDPPKEAKPVMYRWISSLRIALSTGSADRQVEMGITFSLPEAFVPPQVNEEECQAARGPGLCSFTKTQNETTTGEIVIKILS